MSKWTAIFLSLVLCFGVLQDVQAQHKGISFQAVLKKIDGSYPTASGVTIVAQILDPVSHCVLREEEHAGKNISNGYLNLVLGDSTASTPTTRNPSPILTLSQVMDNRTTRLSLKCVDQDNNITSSNGSYTPSNIDRRILRIRLNLNNEEIAADFNMRAVGFAVNSEMLNSKSDEDFVNINPDKGVTKLNLESIFDRFTKLDAILNGFNSSGTAAGISITGNATTATTSTNVTGIVAIANGGTGAGSVSAARGNLGLGSLATMTPTGVADSTTYLRGDGTWQVVSSGGGEVSSVAGRTGAVLLSATDIGGLGQLAVKATTGVADNTTFLRGDGSWTSLGEAAALSLGTGAGTVAAGNDARILGSIQNKGTDAVSNVAAFSAGSDSNKPGLPVTGQMYVATDVQKIYRYDGVSWVVVAQVGSTNFSGNLAGDVSGAQGATVVDRIKGQAVTATATSVGQVLRYNGGNNWTPGFVAMTDLRSTVTGSNSFASSCAANQTLTYNSVGDVMSCQNISGIPAANVTGMHTVATSGSYTDLLNKPTIPAAQVNANWNAVSGVSQILNKPTLGSLALKNSVDLSSTDATGVIDGGRLPASAKYWTAATGGINYAGGNLGVGTSAPAQKLSVAGTVESTSGGFKFPDGTTQSSAATGLVVKDATGQGGAITSCQMKFCYWNGTSLISENGPGTCTESGGTQYMAYCPAGTKVVLSGSGSCTGMRTSRSLVSASPGGKWTSPPAWNVACQAGSYVEVQAMCCN